MTLDQAKQSVGKMVMSRDAGDKMIRRVHKPHGPYKLLQVTKGGTAILEGREDYRIPPSLLVLAVPIEERELTCNWPLFLMAPEEAQQIVNKMVAEYGLTKGV